LKYRRDSMGMKRSLKATNGITGGNFPNGTGWSAYQATIAVANNTLSVTCTGGANYGQAIKNSAIPCVVGKRIYVSFRGRPTNANCLTMRTLITGSSGGSNLSMTATNNPTQNTKYLVSGVSALTDQTGVVQVKPNQTYVDAATANGKVMEVQEIIIIDISSLPTEIQAMADADIKTFCDAIPWFEGTVNSGSMSRNMR
jgi:hypothetical protein